MEYTDDPTRWAFSSIFKGTREQRHFDPFDTRWADWDHYTDYLNQSGQVFANSVVFENGFQDQTHFTVPGDPAHGYTNHFNAAGVLIGTDLF